MASITPTAADAIAFLTAYPTGVVNGTYVPDAGADEYYSVRVRRVAGVADVQLLDSTGRVPSSPPATVSTWATDIETGL